MEIKNVNALRFELTAKKCSANGFYVVAEYSTKKEFENTYYVEYWLGKKDYGIRDFMHGIGIKCEPCALIEEIKKYVLSDINIHISELNKKIEL